MMHLTAIIVDDESAAINSLELLLGKYHPSIEIIKTCNSPVDAIPLIEELQPDILFLDINMPELDGFELLAQLPWTDFFVIFTTAHDEYGVKAIKAEALDYLLKPIARDELAFAIDKAQKLREQQLTQVEQIKQLLLGIESSKKNKKKISIPTNEGIEFIDVDEILYCKSDGSYSTIVLQNQISYLLSKPISFLEDSLPEEIFFRIHNSYIVNVQCIKKYLRGRGGSVVLQEGTILPVSSRRKNDFLSSI